MKYEINCDVKNKPFPVFISLKNFLNLLTTDVISVE